MVHEGMDGSLGVYYQGRRIAFEEAPAERVVLRVKNIKGKARPALGLAEPSLFQPALPNTGKPEDLKRSPKGLKTKPYHPAADHPWRRPYVATNSLNR